MRRRILLGEEGKKEDSAGSSGKKIYIFQNGSLQNGAKFESSRISEFLAIIKRGNDSQSNSMIQDGAIVLKGNHKIQGTEFSITYFDEDGKSQTEMEEDFLKKLKEEYGEAVGSMDYNALRMLDSSEREGTNTGYIYVAQSEDYGPVYGGSCCISLKEIPNFNFSTYKNIGFNIKEYKPTANGKGSVSLSVSNTGKDKKLIEFSADGPIVYPLGNDLNDYNIIKFSTKASSGIGYKITEIYLEE